MPRGDRTGPEGRGPMTGRGAGYCSGNDEPDVENESPRRGFGFGFGLGGGRGLGRRGQGRGQGFGGGRGGGGRGRGFRFWNRNADE